MVLPAEWAPQSAVLFVWPRQWGDWGKQLPGARTSLAQAVAAVAKTQTVILVAPDDESQDSIQAHPALAQVRHNVCISVIAADDVWIRDFGPLTVFESGRRQFLDYRFNGWGAKYPAAQDDLVTQTLSKRGALGDGQYRQRDYVLEGGAIDSNGAGTLLITRRCLLDAARNPGDNEQEWNIRLRSDLGIHTVHWLQNGYLQGDDTDGHVDTLARFVAEDTIAYQACYDAADGHYKPLQAMAAELALLRQQNGQPYKLHPLPLPQAQYDEDGRRLPAGYANFLIANNVVLIPQYNDPADAEALRIISGFFPGRAGYGIDCQPLIRQNGAIHCAAMQIPECPKPR